MANITTKKNYTPSTPGINILIRGSSPQSDLFKENYFLFFVDRMQGIPSMVRLG